MKKWRNVGTSIAGRMIVLKSILNSIPIYWLNLYKIPATGNKNGIGMVMRNSEGKFLKLSTGVLPSSSSIENKLNAIHRGLITAYEDKYKDVILETDNLDAFEILRNFPHEKPGGDLSVKARGDKCNHLYTLKHPVGAVEELLNVDLGFGHIDPQFHAIEVLNDEEDPVDFGPAIIPGEGMMHNSYTYHEFFFAIESEEGPVVVPAYEVSMEDFILGQGFSVNGVVV
ncbi:hypothetical protein POM88_025523 [Heracleum sosnowskyi]|uniref:RNase H type-1 domain-containing protein n=1 Tax=Heracleum sosnowskyi TaxID=360622 RepID=A0AAD8I5E9_9APIA|nr:hypothetical protein POM88_025523 [Heracleum sosnowskyi]